MEDYVCCRELAQQLDEYFLKGDSDRFYELWGSLMGNPEDSSADPNQDLFLLVDFKLKVHFTVMKLLTSNEDNSIEKFSRFLQEKGSIFSKFKELAPYFAIPYITDNPKHFLLLDIQKEEWVQNLRTLWKALWEKRFTLIHGVDKIRLEKQTRKYQNLKDKFVKLKEDHKSLLDLATRLVGALEESLQGETKCSVETFENYNEQIMIYTQSLMKNDASTEKELKKSLEVGFQWEARSLRTSPSSETIGSKNSL